MNLKSIISIILILTLSLLSIGQCERAKDQMYEYFDGRLSCFRRLNGTHQSGCSSKRGGSTGIVHFVEAEEDLNFIIKNAADTGYIPVIPMQLLTQTTMRLLRSAKIFSGLIVYKDNKTLSHYSHERTCPNRLSNSEGTCDVSWNSYGTGLLYEDLPFPIYYVNNNDDLEKMKRCFHTFNNFSYETHNTRSLCLVELDAFMFAAIDTPTCIRRSNLKTNLNPVKFCDPLGGENVWASLFPLESSGNYTVVAARLDTTSLFHGMFPGAVSPITGVVTLLATADYLKRMVGEQTYDKNVLFVLFNGESYDYIGSQRMVYDMERGEFPIKPEADAKYSVPLVQLKDIRLFVELSHLSKSGQIYLHSFNKGNPFFDVLKKHNFTGINQVTGRLPPSSAQTFVKARPNISAVVLANYRDEYANKFYNSINDNASNIDYFYYNTTEDEYVDIPSDSVQQFTANFAEMLAKSLYQEMTGKEYEGSERPRLDLVNELYNCYLLDPDCKVHQAVQRKKLRESPYNSYSLYVGVTVVPNLLTYAIGLTLAWLTGTVTNNNTCVNDPTTPMFQYFNMSKSLDNLNTTVCYRSVMNFSEAVSPAFVIDDYDWTSGQYSSWSESTWKDFNVRMFLRPSPAHERFTLAIGSITLVMSIIVVYFVKSRSNVLFPAVETCSPTSC